ncbi:hypothetical protein Pla163_08790 [Planctomycetes bacterium Pla163]|uniref:Glyoxalase-like domain protein n=1 Tax=Rohdeia mirabilis TaxID=2528008 RepID=A0A518CX55_9BACT|nr:hypothetical protein Pla163_08790 [Planctomycetes bacterium Pla163]
MDHSPLHSIEIVTPDVDGTRALYTDSFGAAFAEPDPLLGGAVVAELPSGSRIGIRVPMHEQESPVVRMDVRVAELT